MVDKAKYYAEDTIAKMHVTFVVPALPKLILVSTFVVYKRFREK